MFAGDAPGNPIYTQSTQYDSAGRVTKRTLGNNAVQTQFTYYAWNIADQGGKLQRIFSQKPGATTHQDLRYTYDKNGNITQLLDYVSLNPQTGNPLTQDFQYDSLDRLTYAISRYGGRGNYPEEYYTYNSTTGNLSSKAGVTYTYGSAAHKHAVTSLSSGNTYQYDQNGNMTQRYANQQTYNFAYDAENHLTAVSGAAQAQFKYNGDGQRVVATEGVTTTVFVGNYFELQFVNGAATQTTKYYFSGGTRVAMQRGNQGVKYLLGDHLGSASVVLNADGTSLGAQGYRPWGSVNFTEGTIPTEYTFTGQYSYVSRFGMAYFNARWYLPELGRFSQPDTIIPEQQQGTIAWDRHAGLNNNPVRYNDPSGHDVDCGLAEPDCDKTLRRQSSTPSSKKDAIDAWEMSPHMPPIAVATINKGGKTTALYAGCSSVNPACTRFYFFRLTYQELLELIRYLNNLIDGDPIQDAANNALGELNPLYEIFSTLLIALTGPREQSISVLVDYLLKVAIEMAASGNYGPITLVVVTGLLEQDPSGKFHPSTHFEAVFVVLDNGVIPRNGEVLLLSYALFWDIYLWFGEYPPF